MNAVERWNAKYPVGTVVEVTKGDGSTFIGETTSAAYALCDGYSVVMLKGYGAYALSAMKAVNE